MATTEVDGLRIAYERSGDGRPIVFVHGYVGDGPTTWRPQLDALADEFAVVAWDAPGAGRSSDPQEPFGMAGYADCLAAFIERLVLVRPTVVGLSFGGALALALCHRHPDVAGSVVLASAYAGWRGSLPAEVADARLHQAMALAECSPDEVVDALLPTMFAEGTPAASVEAFGEAMRTFHPSGFRSMALAAAEDLREALPSVDVPCLLLYGDHDVRAPLSVAEELHAAIAGSTLVVLEGAGHVCNIEAPRAFNEAVRDFVRTGCA